MFGCVVAGRLLQTNLQQVDETHAYFELPNASTINHISVFLLGTVPFPDGYGASVHFHWPGKGFQLLGMLTNEKPSAIFRLRGNYTSDATNTANPDAFAPTSSASSLGSDVTAILGLAIEPISQIQVQVSGLPSTLVKAATQDISRDSTLLAERIVKHLFNFLASFVGGGPGGFGPDLMVPLGLITKWHQMQAQNATTCFSAASNLRCANYTQIQSGILVIPTGIELIFSTALIFTNWGTGWHHLLLTAEGYVYFILTILDLIAHILPAVRDNLNSFVVFDRLLAATSFIPILFYTLFILLFSRKELANRLPRKIQRIVLLTLMLFIPTIVVFNELASFLGIKYIGGGTKQAVSVGIPFSDRFAPSLFANMTLTLLTSYQAISFFLAFYRLLRALYAQRNMEVGDSSSNYSDDRDSLGEKGTSPNQEKIVLFKGTAWIAGGLKLGAIESVVGFVTTGGFDLSLSRRILRTLSRALIIIGLAKGLDLEENFDDVRKEIMSNKEANNKEAKRGPLRPRPSMLTINPRLSTFRQLSPTATSFRPNNPAALPSGAPTSAYLLNNPVPPPQFNTPRRVLRKKASPYATPLATPNSLHSTHPMPTMDEFTRMRDTESSRRVTVRKESGVPTLYMRMSGDWQLSPTTVSETLMSRPVSMAQLEHYRAGSGSMLTKTPLSIVYVDPESEFSDNTIQRSVPASQLMSPLSYSSASNATSYMASSPPPLPSPSFIQNPPTSSGHASTVFSFLAPPLSFSRSTSPVPDPNVTPSLLLRRSLVASPPPVIGRPQKLMRKESNRESLLNPWPEGQLHPYARAVSPQASVRSGVVGLPARPKRAASRGDGILPPSNRTSMNTLTSHVNPMISRTNTPSPLRPLDSNATSDVQQAVSKTESDTGHSDSSHSAYSQATHPDEDTATLRPRNSIKRKMPPPVSPSILLTVDTNIPPANQVMVSKNNTINYHKRIPADIPHSALDTSDPFDDDNMTSVGITPLNESDTGSRYSAALNTGRSGDFAAWKTRKASLRRNSSKRSDLSTTNEVDELAVKELQEHLQKDSPWLRNPPPSAKEFEFKIQTANRVQVGRIKSIGRVPRRSTPVPVRTTHARESMHMAIETLPPAASSLPNDNALRQSRRLSYSFPPVSLERGKYDDADDQVYGRGILRDSEIMAFEEDSPVTGRNPFSRRV
ncbi:hypothetical protein ONZ45_g2658 [Pleurotus djamor]|nr:hypothetical protein ONZ45_g2658 [Pleurotus djamor]